MIYKLNNERKLFWKRGLIFILSIYLIFTYLYALIYIPVNGDAGFYLSVSDELAEGVVPYKEINLSYPPLAMYCLAIVRLLVGNTPVYWPYLLFILLLHSANAFLIYRIAIQICSHFCALLIGLCYLIIVFQIEGVYIMLEPFVVFFSLLAVYFFFYKKTSKAMFWCGVFSGLAFLCKQYGLGTFALIGSFLFLESLQKKINLKVFLSFIIGFAVTLLIGLISLFIQSVTLSQLLKQLFGVSYGHYSVEQWIFYSVTFLKITGFFFLLLVLLVFFIVRKKVLRPRILFLIAAIGGYSLQFYFQPYAHYGIIILPFLLLLLAFFFHYLQQSSFAYTYPYALIFVVLMFFQKNIRNFRYYTTYWDRQIQYERAELVRPFIKDKKTFFPDYPEMYFILDAEPTDLKNSGFGFSNYMTSQALNDLFSQTDVIQISSSPEAKEIYTKSGFFMRFKTLYTHPEFYILGKK